MALYDSIGKTYTDTRKADPRITKRIIEYLNLKTPATIADIGAGTGNYSAKLAEHGYSVLAIEPSKIMIKQGKKHKNLKWVSGFAEDLPLEDNSVNAVICIATIHHFGNMHKAFEEMDRVRKKGGAIVILAVDPSLRDKDCWLDNYFAPYNQSWKGQFPSIDEISRLLQKATNFKIEVKTFNISHDIVDGMFLAGWRRPHLYLDDNFCNGISSLAKAPKKDIHKIQKKLKKDLGSGVWDKKYGYMRKLREYDGGYRFLIAK